MLILAVVYMLARSEDLTGTQRGKCCQMLFDNRIQNPGGINEESNVDHSRGLPTLLLCLPEAG